MRFGRVFTPRATPPAERDYITKAIERASGFREGTLSRRSFLKGAAWATGGIVFYSLFGSVFPGAARAAVSGEESVRIDVKKDAPATLAEVYKQGLTNISSDRAVINRVNTVIVTCDEWNGIVYYTDGKKYYAARFYDDIWEGSGGVFFDRPLILTSDPFGAVYAGRNKDGYYQFSLITNSAGRKGDKNGLEYVRGPPIAVKFFRPDQVREDEVLGNKDDSFCYYEAALLQRGEKIGWWMKKSLVAPFNTLKGDALTDEQIDRFFPVRTKYEPEE